MKTIKHSLSVVAGDVGKLATFTQDKEYDVMALTNVAQDKVTAFRNYVFSLMRFHHRNQHISFLRTCYLMLPTKKTVCHIHLPSWQIKVINPQRPSVPANRSFSVRYWLYFPISPFGN